MICHYAYQTSLGSVTFIEEDGALVAITLQPYKHVLGVFRETLLIKNAYKQLSEYLQGVRTAFDLPLNPHGTPFQLKVWKALAEIPFGETRSYKQIAIAIGHPKAVRAVGMANHRNPLLVVVPCHRVIGANGKPVGYAAGLDKKEYLLKLESSYISKAMI